MKSSWKLLAVVLCAGLSGATAALAQQSSPVKREIVQRGDISVPGREAIVARIDITPGGIVSRHTHPGDEIAYVMEGEGELVIDGEQPRAFKAGDAFVIPAKKIHSAKNTGTAPLTLIGIYVVEKNKSLITPAK